MIHTVNDLIRKLESLDEEKRNLPVSMIAENGLELEPKIKFKYKKYGHPFLGDKPEKVIITWD
jgi:hypothetical protein